MLRLLMFLAVLLYATIPIATADQYWVAWEGNDFPENEGWQRIVNGPQPAERTLADGIMTMDGLADRQIDDYYRMERPLDPEPGETFVMQWRLRVQQVVASPLYPFDPGLSLFSDEDWALAFHLGVDQVSLFHEDIRIPYVPEAFHTFDVRSADMRTYQLSIDGVHAHSGVFWEPTFRSSRIEWGDYARGAASRAEWDYFRFGVVPEPRSGTLLVALLVVACASTTRRIS